MHNISLRSVHQPLLCPSWKLPYLRLCWRSFSLCLRLPVESFVFSQFACQVLLVFAQVVTPCTPPPKLQHSASTTGAWRVKITAITQVTLDRGTESCAEYLNALGIAFMSSFCGVARVSGKLQSPKSSQIFSAPTVCANNIFRIQIMET